MRFKTAPVISMYLAYLIILAHAVIPHHHHASEVCLQTIDSIHSQCSHDQCASGHTAHKECKLTHSEVLPAKSLIVQITSISSYTIDIHLSGIKPVEDGLFKTEYPFPDIGINSQYLKYAATSSILRAPPVA